MPLLLVPIDFEHTKQVALSEACNLAAKIKADILLLHIQETGGFFSGFFGQDQQNEWLSQVDEKLQEMANRYSRETGLRIGSRIETGRIYTKIVETAATAKASYIVMETCSQLEGQEGDKRIGANTSRVIRQAGCPVITISSPHNHPGCRSILLPLDLSQETRQKVNAAIIMAKAYQSSIRVVSALPASPLAEDTIRFGQQMNQVQQFILDAGIPCTTGLIPLTGGDRETVPVLLKYAQAQADIDLIIIMTQQEISFVEYFVGSKAQEFIRLSEIPVMSVVPQELGFTNIFS